MGMEARGIQHAVEGGPLLNGVSVAFGAGWISAIVGPEGAGPSTLIRLLGGRMAPSLGRVWLNGKRLSMHAPTPLKCLLALVPQDTRVALDHTVQEAVTQGRFAHRYAPSLDEAAIVRSAMAVAGMADCAGQVLNALPPPHRARALLAAAMAQIWEPVPSQSARWLLLEELDPAIDTVQRQQILRVACDWARAKRIGMVCAVADADMAQRHADDLVRMPQG